MDESVKIKRGQELELQIESLAYGGMGLARENEFVIFVKGAIPGQLVRARIYKKRKGYAEANVQNIIEESPFSQQPRCNHFYTCSKLQNILYEVQLNEKENQVKSIFERLGGFSNFTLNDIISANETFNYRNKMEFTFSPNRWVLDHEPECADKSFALGLHMTGRFDKILNIRNCHLQPEIGNRILKISRNICLKNPSLKPYNPKTHIGFLRFLMLRFGINTNQLMINIVTAYDDLNKLSPLTDALLDQVPEITSMVNNVNTRKADVAFGEYETLIYGSSTIEEKIGELTFEISANSFFQTNTTQGTMLYKKVKEIADLSGDETIYDLYCGTGTIGLFLSSKAKQVYGFEVIRSSLENAERNALKNNIKNVQFQKANLDTFFRSGQLPRSTPKPDIVIVDPPRAGMHPDMTQHLPKLNAKKIIYISCNPTTQARDAKILNEKGYTIKYTAMVDMFPHTPHIETVVLFSK